MIFLEGGRVVDPATRVDVRESRTIVDEFENETRKETPV